MSPYTYHQSTPLTQHIDLRQCSAPSLGYPMLTLTLCRRSAIAQELGLSHDLKSPVGYTSNWPISHLPICSDVYSESVPMRDDRCRHSSSGSRFRANHSFRNHDLGITGSQRLYAPIDDQRMIDITFNARLDGIDLNLILFGNESTLSPAVRFYLLCRLLGRYVFALALDTRQSISQPALDSHIALAIASTKSR